MLVSSCLHLFPQRWRRFSRRADPPEGTTTPPRPASTGRERDDSFDVDGDVDVLSRLATPGQVANTIRQPQD